MNDILPGSELSFLLVDAARLWRQAVERALSDAALSFTASELRALTYIGRHQGSRQKELASLMGIEAMTLSGFIEALEKRGLVERQVDPIDRRARHIYLTSRSATVFESIAPVSSMVQAHALADLSAKQRQDLEGALRAIRRSLMLPGRARSSDLPSVDDQLTAA